MTAQTLALTAEQGGTYGQLIICRDETSTLINFSGFTARMQVRDGYGAALPTFDLTTANGGIALGGALGTITLAISATDLAAIVLPPAASQLGQPSKAFVYDLEVVNGVIVTRLLQGTFTITGEVTR